MNQGYEQIGVAVTCRSFEEYVRMFDLQENELIGRLLDIAGGASSFTADAAAKGLDAYAADPRFVYDHEQLTNEAKQEIADSSAKLQRLSGKFDLSYYGSMANHRAGREASLQRFAAHYADASVRAERYLAGKLPNLPFADAQFDVVFCSHFLFLYEEQFDYAFHRHALFEMMRICKPGGCIRIYPVVTLQWKPYTYMEELLQAIRERGGSPGFFRSKLPFIPGSELGLFVNL
ncbi:class I SAM-dependent methyltransferase [Paenibacillus sp. R14(2021)]|uniref:methyltransferase domain-containing protein n=1 Tax=Paenibacillus sp. R14(2021) TaxID=2859228 RepID=UPI0021585CF0|nr:class I SAM-dependent methyltransferase [Paenibacillus sp. R14(2021)]